MRQTKTTIKEWLMNKRRKPYCNSKSKSKSKRKSNSNTLPRKVGREDRARKGSEWNNVVIYLSI
jgi:hypothetical protein